jgi:hypothetical protein
MASLNDLDSTRKAWIANVKRKHDPTNKLSLDSLLIINSQRDAGDPKDYVFVVLDLLFKRDSILLPNYKDKVSLSIRKL